MGVPKGREAGEIGGNYATLHNISQSKKGKREEAKKKGAGAGIAWYGRREVWTPLSAPLRQRWKKIQIRPHDNQANGVFFIYEKCTSARKALWVTLAL